MSLTLKFTSNMVGCDTNSNQHSRSCSCSCTSIVYSELLSDDETIIAGSVPETGCSGTPNGAHSPKCTCPPARHKAPVAVISDDDIFSRPLSTTTCLPQPLPPTPIVSRKNLNNFYYREPDYLRLERTLISTFAGKPFMPQEPERVFYTRSSPKCFGELFCAHFDNVLRLKKYRLHRAAYVIPTDPLNTPFHSVVYLKGERKVESIPMLKERKVESIPMLKEAQIVELAKEEPPVPHYAVPVTPQGTSRLESTSGWDSVLRALASPAAPSSSKSSCNDPADEVARMWRETYEKEVNAQKDGTSLYSSGSSTTPSRSFEATCSSNKISKPSKKESVKEHNTLATTDNDTTSWEEPLTERGAYRSESNVSLVSVRRSPSASSNFTEWEEEIQRLRSFLEAEKSQSNISCYTAKTISSLNVGGPTASMTALHGSNNGVTFASKFAKIASNGRKAIASWTKKTILKKN